MTWSVVWTDRAGRDMRRLDHTVAARVLRAIERFAETGAGNVKRLRGYDDEWRLRVGDWRARFTYDPTAGTIQVLRVLPRRQAYR